MTPELTFASDFQERNLTGVRLAILFGEADNRLGRNVARFFEGIGATVWTKESIMPGALISFDVSIAMKTADFIIILVSSSVMQTVEKFHQYVGYAHAAALEMPESGVKLLPILVDDDARLPDKLADLLAGKLSDPRLGRQLLSAMRREWDRRSRHHDW